MPREQEALGWRQFWRYIGEVLNEAGPPPLWEWLAAIITAVVGLLVDRQLTDTWSWAVPLAAGLGMGLIMYAFGLIRAAARIDGRQKRQLRTLAGELTTPEAVQGNQERMRLQRLAFKLLNYYLDYWDACAASSEERMVETEDVMRAAAEELRELATATVSYRGAQYATALMKFDLVAKRSDLHPFAKSGLYEAALKDLEPLEHEDRLWVQKNRILRPPAVPR